MSRGQRQLLLALPSALDRGHGIAAACVEARICNDGAVRAMIISAADLCSTFVLDIVPMLD